MTVVVDPADYGWVADKVSASGLTDEDRRSLAAKAFHHVASYDAAVAAYLSATAEEETEESESLPENLKISLVQTASLRYGENPHQAGALYVAEGVTSRRCGGSPAAARAGTFL